MIQSLEWGQLSIQEPQRNPATEKFVQREASIATTVPIEEGASGLRAARAKLSREKYDYASACHCNASIGVRVFICAVDATLGIPAKVVLQPIRRLAPESNVDFDDIGH